MGDDLRRLGEIGTRIWLRVPVVPAINANDAEMGAMAVFARANVRAEQVNLLPYRKLGQDKRPDANFFDEPSPERMKRIGAIWRDCGFERVKMRRMKSDRTGF